MSSMKLSNQFSYESSALNAVGDGSSRSYQRFESSINSPYVISSSGGGNNKITIDVSSGDKFLLSDKGYLTWDIQTNVADGTVAHTSAGLGHSLIDRLVISAGGSILEDISSYSAIASYMNGSASPQQKTFMGVSQQYGNTASLVGGATVSVATSLYSGLLGTEQAIPLPAIRSPCLRFEIYLAPLSKILTTTGAVASISITNIKYCCEMVSSPALLASVYSELSAGKSISLDYSALNRVNVINAVNSGQNVLNFNCGYDTTSLENLIVVYQTGAKVNSLTDFSNPALQSYYWKIQGTQLPAQGSVLVSNAGGGFNPEVFMRSNYPSDFYNLTTSITQPQFLNNYFGLELNSKLSNDCFADGWNLAQSNGTVSLYLTHNTAPSTADLFTAWTMISSRVSINQQSINVFKTFD
jgi:hypothetical protein